MKGTIKKKTDRGFGFISRTDSSDDLFFHSNNLKGVSFDELEEGTAVTFEIENGQKGPAAINVQVVQDDSGDNQTEETEASEDETEEKSNEKEVENGE